MIRLMVLPHIGTALALAFFIWPFREVSVAFVIRRGGGIMGDFRNDKSTDFLYEVGNVFLRLQLRVCGAN